MKTLSEKIEICDKLMHQLVQKKDPLSHERTKRYYFVLKIWKKLRDEKKAKSN